MKGYLYVEEDLLGKPNKTFVKRYFVSYKFCGLKWFSKEPADITNAVYLQCISNETCGWVFGSSIIAEQVEAESQLKHKDTVIYPFSVYLKCGEYTTSVRFACKTDDIRKRWVEDINQNIKMLSYLSSCHQSDVLPHPMIFDAMKDKVEDEMRLTAGPVSTRHLHAMAHYYNTCYPHGLMLHSFLLENAQLNDSMVPIVCAILEQAPYVGVLSLAENVLSSAGATALCDTLVRCVYLTEVNLSNNFLCDNCADTLSRALGMLTELKVLNLSHNQFTQESVRPFTLRLATHRSKLAEINFAYNPLGDGIASFIALLCQNQPSHLQSVDISWCGVGDAGAAELSEAILPCKTLQSIALHGSYLGTKSMQLLVKNLSDHQLTSHRSRQGRGLSLEIGGIDQDSTDAVCLSLKALKASLMYVADVAHIRGIVLRRRLLYAQPLAHQTTADDLINPLHRLQHELEEQAQEAYPVARLVLCLPEHVRTPYEVLEELAMYLECDVGQLVLLSCTRTEANTATVSRSADVKDAKAASSKASKTASAAPKASPRHAVHTVIFTVLNCPANRASWRQNNSYMHSFPTIMGTTTKRIVEATVRGQSITEGSASVLGAPTPAPAAAQTSDGAPASAALKLLNYRPGTFFDEDTGLDKEERSRHALYKAAYLKSAQEIMVSLHKLGSNSHHFLRALGVRSVALKYPNPAFLETIHEPEYVVFHTMVRHAGTRGRGLNDHYLPVLCPRMPTQAEANANFHVPPEDTDDDDTFDTAVRTKPRPAECTLAIGSAAGADGKGAGGLATVAEATDENADDIEHRYVTASEEFMIQSLQIRQRRTVNERLITAVRQLYAEKELSGLQARFWEGAFGNLKHKSVTQAGLKLALNPETSTFAAIHLRQQLYEAMLQRDLPRMNVLILELQSKGSAQGGLALVYALRLRSEIIGLQRTYHDIAALARSYSELHMVEDFLLSCGKLGYSGPEMFQAVELRSELVAQGATQRRRNVAADMPMIKHKALYSNLLISREVETLDLKLDELKTAGQAPQTDLLQVPECVAAEHLLQEYQHTYVLIKSAIKLRNIDTLDQALAQAAYHFFYFEEVSRAVNVLNEISGNPSNLLRPVVEALRANDVSNVAATFQLIEKVGWLHPAMDATVCTKINDRQNKINQDEVVKSKLIKFCLAIKNGFKVNANEMMQLLRRSYKLKLDVDPVMSGYLKTVSKSVKQFAGLLKQEKQIQQLIDDNAVAVLAKLLDGRGSGKLVMCCPSGYIQDEWMYYLQACCDGRFKDGAQDEDGNFKEQEVFFTGTLEKAARNDQGLVRGWRQRFFQLNTTSLSYFTKPRGDRKGIIRVIGGGVRRMEPAEAGGRMFCIELEEGRDISLIDPDLLAEARRHVLQAKTKEFEAAVRRGITLKSLDLLTRMLKYASDSNISLDYNLVNEAKACINSLKEKNLKRDLRFAAKLVPRSQLDELIALAEKLSLDPNIPSYRTVLALAAKSEVEQHLIRARGAMEVRDEALFARAFLAISRFDLSQLATRHRCQLAALILQHSGYHVLHLASKGNPLSGATRINKHALSCCLQLMVETEPMDLSRLLVALAHRTITVTRNSSYVSHSFVPVADLRVDKASSIAVYLEELNLNYATKAQYDITKYKQLRISSVYRYKGLGIAAALQAGRRQNDKSNEIMRYSTVPLLKSLLKYDTATAINPRLHLEAFSILLAIMGDKPLSSLSRPAKGTVLQSKTMSTASAVLDLIDAAVARYPVMRNELYFQLIKQLTENPNRRSWVRGWLLLTIYLHSFPPTFDALPYIRNYVDVSLETATAEVHALAAAASLNEEATVADSSPTKGAAAAAAAATAARNKLSEEDLSAMKYCVKVMAYCSISLSRMEIMLHNNKATNLDSAGAPLLYKPIVASTSAHFQAENVNTLTPDLNSAMVDRIYDQKGMDFEIALMTGSVLKFTLPYGQCSTPFSLLLYLYDKLLPEDAFFESTHHTFQQEEALAAQEAENNANNSAVTTSVASSYLSPEMKVHRVLSLFRGFALYSLRETDYDAEGSDIDLQKIPVQPDYSQCIDWTKDLQWDLLHLHTAEEQGTVATDPGVLNGAFKFSNSLLLRRKTSMLHEQFCDEFELFQDQVSDRDVTALQGLWAKWLSADVVSLPSDHVRVDLIYAEDTRYVNSRLYPLSADSFHYLLAMQLALCWIDGEAGEWAEIDETVMMNATISVRPCYKFPPQHLIDAPLPGANRRGLTAAEELDLYVSDSAAAANAAKGDETKAEGTDSDDSDSEPAGRKNDYSDVESDTSSEYVSSVASVSTPELIVLTPLIVGTPLTESDEALLLHLVALAGVTADSIDLDQVAQRIAQFHAIALEANVPISSPKYRYLMKRAYVHYLGAASAFYGNHFAEAVLVPDPSNASGRKRTKKAKARKDNNKKKGKNPGVWDEMSEEEEEVMEPADVLVAISVGSLVLLDPETWAVRFSTPIWDIQDFSVIIADNDTQLLVLSINGLEIGLQGEKVHEILDLIDACCREALGRGFFPYGSEAATVTHTPQMGAQSASAAGTDQDGDVQLLDSKKLLRTFLHTFPMMPRPPIPETASRAATGYLAAPKSQRDVFAKERAEEERQEHEMARAAAEAQLMRNQRHIEQGRDDMKKYQKTADKAEDGENSDLSESEEGAVGGFRRHSAFARKKKNNRSVFGGHDSTEEIRKQMIQDRITSVACGVTKKSSSRFSDLPIPAVPTRVAGVVKLTTSNDKKRTLRRPVILESRGLREALERPPVRVSLAADDLIAQAAPSAPLISKSALSKGKAPTAGVVGAPGATTVGFSPNTQESESAVLAYGNDRLQSAILEHSASVVMQFQHRAEAVQQQRLYCAELIASNTMAAIRYDQRAPQEQYQQRLQEDAGADEAEEAGVDQQGGANAGNAGGEVRVKDPYLYGISHYLRKKKRSNATPADDYIASQQQE